jgi:hypothetical protein
LWFWNTELGWASVHPVLTAHGWDYVQLMFWNKGRGHVAGNVNGQTIRRFPVVTEVCAFYLPAGLYPHRAGRADAAQAVDPARMDPRGACRCPRRMRRAV